MLVLRINLWSAIWANEEVIQSLLILYGKFAVSEKKISFSWEKLIKKVVKMELKLTLILKTLLLVKNEEKKR